MKIFGILFTTAAATTISLSFLMIKTTSSFFIPASYTTRKFYHHSRCCYSSSPSNSFPPLFFNSDVITKTILFSSKTKEELDVHNNIQQQQQEKKEILSILHKYGHKHNVVSLSTDNLKRELTLAEIYAGGKYQLCIIQGFLTPSSIDKPPLVKVLPIISSPDDNNDDGMMMVVDMGQITTIWKQQQQQIVNTKTQSYLQSILTQATESIQQDFPITHLENSMQRLYNSHFNRGKSTKKQNYNKLSKKQISSIASKTSNPPKVTELLRKLVKSGDALIDSDVAMDYIYNDYVTSGNKKNREEELIKRRCVSAELLSQDANLGGRFKRMGCTFISADYDYDDTSGALKEVKAVTLLNGGWIAVDLSVRAGTEARKFAQRSNISENNVLSSSSSSELKNNAGRKASLGVTLMTEADERIARRLECLAMGEVFNGDNDNTFDDDEQRLELDVRETLKTMNLPISPAGAKKALVQIGRWSENNEKMNMVEPWAQETLTAAQGLARKEIVRRTTLYKQSALGGGSAKQQQALSLEGRIDLTTLPCVCVDAKRTSFRDDAIGVRPRSSTGRKVISEASKWEILIHIADVSDIYFSFKKKIDSVNNVIDLIPLKRAAESRGLSRYDLPLGPLHLMPPVALEALALVTESLGSQSSISPPQKCVNRCVTLWAYIDERSGKLLDAGLERTVISPPLALTFQGASTLMEHNGDTQKQPGMAKAKAILSVAERNLSLWSTYHQQKNEAARKREERLSVKEFISKEVMTVPSDVRDDGVGGSFQRTRGHRLVDSALDLYGYAVTGLIKRCKQPIPRASGSGATSRGGRLGTAPLRRYIDGVAQRQALSVLCMYGGPPLNREECAQANRIADKATNAMSNIRSMKKSNGESAIVGTRQGGNRRTINALRSLSKHIARISSDSDNVAAVPSISTGRANEVAILGIGVTVKCAGVKGTLKSGERVMVEVTKLEPERGILKVKLYQKE